MQIHEYARRGDIVGAAHELADGVEVDCIEEYSYFQTPLMFAAASADAGLDMLQFLVKNGANVNAIEPEMQRSVLFFAVQSGNLDKIQFLLDTGADLHHKSYYGGDVLMDAVEDSENLISILDFLIRRGASVNGVDSYQNSALKYASNIGRFDAVKFLLAAGADYAQLEWTALMHAVALGSLDEVKAQLDQGTDLSARDHRGRTAWLLSLQVGDLEKTKLLLATGSDRSDRDHFRTEPLTHPIAQNKADVLAWLIEEGFDIEAMDESGTTPLILAAKHGATECVRVLLKHGADPSRCRDSYSTAIGGARNLEIVRMLVRAGEDLSHINEEMRQLLLGVSHHDVKISQEQFLAGRNRRFGNANPELMEVDFWRAMVASSKSAYFARVTFDNADSFNEPIWCYQRFGRTITELPDGRIIEIAGEHEDFYDPDFCIYNDVVVYQGDGTFKIFGYPKEIFPPIDFHTATLVGNYIYIIGNLGYITERIPDETPVYRLHCDTFSIEKIETTGDKPGWISRHKACYKVPEQIHVTGGKVIVLTDDEMQYIENSADYTLNLKTLNWSRLSA